MKTRHLIFISIVFLISSAYASMYGFIGVGIIDHPDGVLILNVLQGSPAEIAGLRTNDIIIRVDDYPVHSVDKFKHYVLSNPGVIMSLYIIRTDIYGQIEFSGYIPVQIGANEYVQPVPSKRKYNRNKKTQSKYEGSEWSVCQSCYIERNAFSCAQVRNYNYNCGQFGLPMRDTRKRDRIISNEQCDLLLTGCELGCINSYNDKNHLMDACQKRCKREWNDCIKP
ncbi:MAG: PDZ domain-containing protein [Desulfobacteraceae bacterium]|nr:PDZ domain-containing protein [Desulfobacteraceae bacterium]